MAKVAIITSYFPFGAPEQFFEAEIPMWAASDHEVTLLPMRSQGPAREVPRGIKLDTGLAVLDSRKRRGTLTHILRACTDRSTLREVLQTVTDRRFKLRIVAEIISTQAQVTYLQRKLNQIVERDGGYDVVYAYWHGTAAYAAGAAAASGSKIGFVVARAHRVDVYEEARPSGHHPRKRHYQRYIDLHAPISQAGADYLTGAYGIDPNRVMVSRLGCTVTGDRSRTSRHGEIHLLSSSFVTPLKRVDGILRSVIEFARQNPALHVHWTHLGSGPSFGALDAIVRQHGAPNLTITLPGQVPHGDVLAHLTEQPVDVFVNFSTSEGVPVSIMEAMAKGVPAIAPAVGGVSEIVDDAVGRLLPRTATEEDLVRALTDLTEPAKLAPMRDGAAKRVSTVYDANANFERFISTITATR